MKASVNKVVSKVISSKVVLATLLVLTAVTVGLVGWVYLGTLATIKGKVLAPYAVVEVARVNLGNIKAGYPFKAITYPDDQLGTIIIENAKELKARIYVDGLDEIEKEALKVCNATIIIVGEDYVGYIEVDPSTGEITHPPVVVAFMGTLDCLSNETLVTTLSEGIYKVFVQVEGVAGYPKEDCEISFDILIKLEPPEE